jgi:hypothetical protein
MPRIEVDSGKSNKTGRNSNPRPTICSQRRERIHWQKVTLKPFCSDESIPIMAIKAII